MANHLTPRIFYSKVGLVIYTCIQGAKWKIKILRLAWTFLKTTEEKIWRDLKSVSWNSGRMRTEYYYISFFRVTEWKFLYLAPQDDAVLGSLVVLGPQGGRRAIAQCSEFSKKKRELIIDPSLTIIDRICSRKQIEQIT
jgi:hypothetical protein